MTEIKKRWMSVIEQIQLASEKAERSPNDVQLLAVSKTWPATILRQLAEAGQSSFGENYLQEALQKIQELSDLSLQWHFIGPIQSNKTREIAANFNWVQSVDRFKIAKRLAEQRPEQLPPLNICLQVNIDNEASKAGVHVGDLFALAESINQLERLKLRGIMVIPQAGTSLEQQRQTFQRCYQLFAEMQKNYSSVDTLSMGMSADLEVAIAEGSSLVRVGTALFGARHTTQA